jgi:hypothetical protein
MLQIVAWVELGVCWVVWALAFVKPQKRAAGAKKAERAPASRWGIFFVMLGFACIWAFVRPVGFEKSAASLIASMVWDRHRWCWSGWQHATSTSNGDLKRP